MNPAAAFSSVLKIGTCSLTLARDRRRASGPESEKGDRTQAQVSGKTVRFARIAAVTRPDFAACCGTVMHGRDCPRGGHGENPWNFLKAKIMIKRQIKAILTGLAATIFFAGVGSADPKGVWLTPAGNSHIEILSCGKKLCGKLVWFTEPRNADGTPKLDVKNKNVALQTRPLLGLQLMSGFTAAGDGKWTKGRIYNPEDGQTYRSKLEVKDQDTLSVSGCVLFFCKDQIWTRVE